MAERAQDPGLPKAYLFLENQDRFIRFLFTRARTLIGSADDNDIVIRDPSVLPRHAEIFVAGDEYHLVAVTGGRTEVEGAPVMGVRPLYNGEELRLGNVVVLFTREARMSDNTLNLIIERAADVPFGVTIAKPIIRIGRTHGDILIDDDELLSTHALIENFCPNGVFVLSVKNKATMLLNGTPVDGRRRLHDGDELRLGTTRMLVGYAEAIAQGVKPQLRRPAGDLERPSPISATTASPARAGAPDSHVAAHSAKTSRPTEMVDVSDLPKSGGLPPLPPPASVIVQVPVAPSYAPPVHGYAASGPVEEPQAGPWRPPTPAESAEPLPAYPDIAAASDFVGSRHYLPRTYRAGKTADSSPEANWGAAPDKQPRRPSQMNMTTAIPSPARVRRAVEEERQEGTTDSLWYHPEGESKLVDD